MDYDVYHDESMEAGYWHGILLVPRATRRHLLELLARLRANTGFKDPLTLKGLTKMTGPRYRCIRGWTHLGSTALVQNLKGEPLPVYTGLDRPNPELHQIGARFILFRVRDGHAQLSSAMTHTAKVETTFRMGLKGGLHLFSRVSGPIRVASLHFDGHLHHRRHLDRDRIIGRLGQLKEGITIADDVDLQDGTGDHRQIEHCQPYDDCQLLQLTDLVVSGFRTVLGQQTHPAQGRVAAPLRALADRWHEGPARMANSRWNGGFCISECYLENDEWCFSDIQVKDDRQGALF